MSTAYVRRPKGGSVLIAKRDYDELMERGWCVAHDYVEVDSELVVMEVDTVKLTSKVVGFARSPGNVRKMAGHVNSWWNQANPLVRRRDIVTLAIIAKRSERVRKSIEQHAQSPLWPEPFVVLGQTHTFRWQDVKRYFRNKGLAVRQRSEASNKRPSPKAKKG